MKYLLICIIVMGAFVSNAQVSDIKDIRNIDDVNTVDMYRMMNLLGLNVQKYAISSKYKAYYCNLIMEEFKDGKLINTFNARNNIGKENAWVINIGQNLESNNFPVSFYSQEYADTVLKVKIHVGEMEFKRDLIKRKGEVYTWKQINNIKAIDKPLIPQEKYPLLVYTTPVGEKHAKTPGASEFCLINGVEIPVVAWYKELGIKHYYAFYLQLEK